PGEVAAGAALTVLGSGVDPNATQVQLPGVASPVTADPASIQQSAGTQASVTVPPGVDPTGQATVITTGGTSNPFSFIQTEVEPNDTPATATPFAFVDIGVTATISATINPAGDVDYYQAFITGGL